MALGSFSAADPQISPDGKWIACRVQQERDRWFVALIPFDGKGDVRPLPQAHQPFRWYPTGEALTTSITDRHGAANLWNIPLDGSAGRQITRFDDDQSILSFAWSRSGTRLACVRLLHNSDVVLFRRQASRDPGQ